MAKRISDIVRDKMLKARGGRTDASLGNPVILTDSDACDLWSALSSIEAEVSMLKSVEFRALKERFSKIDKYLHVAKTKMPKKRGR